MFSIVFSDFEPCYSRAKVGRMYSFTLSWEVEVAGKLLGMSMTRCQFQRLGTDRGKPPLYRWAPAQNVKGFARFHNNIPYPDFYQYVLGELMKTPQASRLGRPQEDLNEAES